MTTFDFEGYLAERDRAQTQAASALRLLVDDNDKAHVQIGQLQQQVADLQAELDAQQPPPAAPSTTVFGACPAKGGTSLAAQTTVVTKWGKAVSARQFFGGFSACPRDPNVGILHASWKPANVAAITEAIVKAAVAPLKAGDFVEVWHEPDVKDRNGSLSPVSAAAMKDAFHKIIKKVRPDLNTINTLSAWTFNPDAKLDPNKYTFTADYVGIDCDGTHPTKLPYTDYEDEIRAVRAYATANGYKGYAVPEFGCPRIPTAGVDPEGRERAKWIDYYAAIWAKDRQCAFVTFFDYGGPTFPYTLDKPAELAAWSAYTKVAAG